MIDDVARRPGGEAGGAVRQKVLLVDDHPLSLAFAVAELEDMCTPLQACSGEEALRLARDEQPDLILLDVRMSGMDGFEVCRRLKQDAVTAGIPVIFLTVLDEAVDEAFGLNLGAIDYISKPFSSAILRARVRNHLLSQRQRQQLERIAQVDGLTGIANRRRFDNDLQAHWRIHRERGQSLALLLIDIDFFKELNDRNGHQAGDRALQRVALAVEAEMPGQGALAARYGGEEFGCILPRTALGDAHDIGERIRQSVVALRIPHPASPIVPWVTVSIGIGCAPDGGESPAALLAEADRCLYRAKEDGRHRVVSR